MLVLFAKHGGTGDVFPITTPIILSHLYTRSKGKAPGGFSNTTSSNTTPRIGLELFPRRTPGENNALPLTVTRRSVIFVNDTHPCVGHCPSGYWSAQSRPRLVPGSCCCCGPIQMGHQRGSSIVTSS